MSAEASDVSSPGPDRHPDEDPDKSNKRKLSAGSSSPRQEDGDKGKKKPKQQQSLNSVCKICGAPAADHLHYGAYCCYSCRAFFRRSGHRVYKCAKQNDSCDVAGSRKTCKKCRYRKCLEAGMKPALVDKQLREREKKKKEKGGGGGGEDDELPDGEEDEDVDPGGVSPPKSDIKVEIKEEQTSPEPEPRSFGGKVSPQQDEPINFAQDDGPICPDTTTASDSEDAKSPDESKPAAAVANSPAGYPAQISPDCGSYPSQISPGYPVPSSSGYQSSPGYPSPASSAGYPARFPDEFPVQSPFGQYQERQMAAKVPRRSKTKSGSSPHPRSPAPSSTPSPNYQQCIEMMNQANMVANAAASMNQAAEGISPAAMAAAAAVRMNQAAAVAAGMKQAAAAAAAAGGMNKFPPVTSHAPASLGQGIFGAQDSFRWSTKGQGRAATVSQQQGGGHRSTSFYSAPSPPTVPGVPPGFPYTGGFMKPQPGLQHQQQQQQSVLMGAGNQRYRPQAAAPQDMWKSGGPSPWDREHEKSAARSFANSARDNLRGFLAAAERRDHLVPGVGPGPQLARDHHHSPPLHPFDLSGHGGSGGPYGAMEDRGQRNNSGDKRYGHNMDDRGHMDDRSLAGHMNDQRRFGSMNDQRRFGNMNDRVGHMADRRGPVDDHHNRHRGGENYGSALMEDSGPFLKSPRGLNDATTTVSEPRARGHQEQQQLLQRRRSSANSSVINTVGRVGYQDVEPTVSVAEQTMQQRPRIIFHSSKPNESSYADTTPTTTNSAVEPRKLCGSDQPSPTEMSGIPDPRDQHYNDIDISPHHQSKEPYHSQSSHEEKDEIKDDQMYYKGQQVSYINQLSSQMKEGEGLMSDINELLDSLTSPQSEKRQVFLNQLMMSPPFEFDRQQVTSSSSSFAFIEMERLTPIMDMTREEFVLLKERIRSWELITCKVMRMNSESGVDTEYKEPNGVVKEAEASTSAVQDSTDVVDENGANLIETIGKEGKLAVRIRCTTLVAIGVRMFGGPEHDFFPNDPATKDNFYKKYGYLLKSPWAASYTEESIVTTTLKEVGKLLGADRALEVLFTNCVMVGFNTNRSQEQFLRHLGAHPDSFPRNQALFLYRYLKHKTGPKKGHSTFMKLEALVNKLETSAQIFFHHRLML